MCDALTQNTSLSPRYYRIVINFLLLSALANENDKKGHVLLFGFCLHLSFSLIFGNRRETPSPLYQREMSRNGLKPAVSLAQLCDLSDPDEAPSSHRLIAQWESIIQQNQ